MFSETSGTIKEMFHRCRRYLRSYSVLQKRIKGKKYYSHKFDGTALQYEICLCILTVDIVWVNRPQKSGVINDISIFASKLGSM